MQFRCEGKHKPMKNYTKSTSNRINICYSIGKKNQYSFAQRLIESKGFEDDISAKIRDTGPIDSKVILYILHACGCNNISFLLVIGRNLLRLVIFYFHSFHSLVNYHRHVVTRIRERDNLYKSLDPLRLHSAKYI